MVQPRSPSRRPPDPLSASLFHSRFQPPRLLTGMTLRWFGLSAWPASPEDLPPSLLQHSLCRRSSTSSPHSFQDTRSPRVWPLCRPTILDCSNHHVGYWSSNSSGLPCCSVCQSLISDHHKNKIPNPLLTVRPFTIYRLRAVRLRRFFAVMLARQGDQGRQASWISWS